MRTCPVSYNAQAGQEMTLGARLRLAVGESILVMSVAEAEECADTGWRNRSRVKTMQNDWRDLSLQRGT